MFQGGYSPFLSPLSVENSSEFSKHKITAPMKCNAFSVLAPSFLAVFIIYFCHQFHYNLLGPFSYFSLDEPFCYPMYYNSIFYIDYVIAAIGTLLTTSIYKFHGVTTCYLFSLVLILFNILFMKTAFHERNCQVLLVSAMISSINSAVIRSTTLFSFFLIVNWHKFAKLLGFLLLCGRYFNSSLVF